MHADDQTRPSHRKEARDSGRRTEGASVCNFLYCMYSYSSRRTVLSVLSAEKARDGEALTSERRGQDRAERRKESSQTECVIS